MTLGSREDWWARPEDITECLPVSWLGSRFRAREEMAAEALGSEVGRQPSPQNPKKWVRERGIQASHSGLPEVRGHRTQGDIFPDTHPTPWPLEVPGVGPQVKGPCPQLVFEIPDTQARKPAQHLTLGHLGGAAILHPHPQAQGC